MTRYISRLVLGHVTFLLNDLLHPPGHTLHQRPQVFRVSHPFKPEHFDGLLQLGYAGEKLAVELLPHPNPAILNRVKVRRVPTAPQPSFFPPWSTVLLSFVLTVKTVTSNWPRPGDFENHACVQLFATVYTITPARSGLRQNDRKRILNNRTQFFLQFFFRGAGIYTFAAASFAFVDCICHSVIWWPDLYSGNLYSGNLCSGNLYSGNLYSGNSFGFYLIKKLFSQISKILLWKIWQNHFFVARNLAISIYCHEKSGNFTFLSQEIWQFHFFVARNLAISLFVARIWSISLFCH